MLEESEPDSYWQNWKWGTGLTDKERGVWFNHRENGAERIQICGSHSPPQNPDSPGKSCHVFCRTEVWD